MAGAVAASGSKASLFFESFFGGSSTSYVGIQREKSGIPVIQNAVTTDCATAETAQRKYCARLPYGRRLLHIRLTISA
jgi:hypothetical protein